MHSPWSHALAVAVICIMWPPFILYRLGEVCSHVAAVLFKVEAIVRLGYTGVACTSRPCEWNQAFSKKVYMNIWTYDADSASMHVHTCLSYTCRFQQLEL